jgi:hypothetical protein
MKGLQIGAFLRAANTRKMPPRQSPRVDHQEIRALLSLANTRILDASAHGRGHPHAVGGATVTNSVLRDGPQNRRLDGKQRRPRRPSPEGLLLPLYLGDRLTEVEARACRECFVESLGSQRLTDLSEQVRLAAPLHRPRPIPYAPAQALGCSSEECSSIGIAACQRQVGVAGQNRLVLQMLFMSRLRTSPSSTGQHGPGRGRMPAV